MNNLIDQKATKITSMGTAKAFTRDACSGTLMGVLDRAFGSPMEAEESASNPLAGGIVQHGYQCGQLWGSALAAGAQAYRLYGSTPRAEAAAVRTAGRLVATFEKSNQESNCLELTDTDMRKISGVVKYFFKGGPISCGRMAVRFAPVAFDEINSSLAEEPTEPAFPCASCAALVARRMGASEQHTVMAAALVGGIGLSGGGCGALGAAIWITGMNNPDEKIGLTADNTKVGEVIEAFVEAADHEFECAEIAGRRFEDVDDHARYVGGGGCAGIIDALVQVANADTGHDEQLAA